MPEQSIALKLLGAIIDANQLKIIQTTKKNKSINLKSSVLGKIEI